MTKGDMVYVYKKLIDTSMIKSGHYRAGFMNSTIRGSDVNYDKVNISTSNHKDIFGKYLNNELNSLEDIYLYKTIEMVVPIKTMLDLGYEFTDLQIVTEQQKEKYGLKRVFFRA